ncbi:MAG: hypothetical protein CVV39_02345 [Planctomycetes bacterium HGW-Planctomycetes-1]|nr:MAG: hypothetical protein CVV39_02345 [Planctomycetes bacterium HGW-Planctomycetes-1]
MKNNNIKYAQSRLQRNILLLSAFLLASALVWLDRNVISRDKPAAGEQTASLSDWDKYNGKSFTVVKVVDGDTIDINIPDPPSLKLRRAGGNYANTSPVRDKTSLMSDGRLGRPVSNGTRIRLWGVDTPETKHPKLGVMHFGPEAAEFTEKMCFEKQVTVYLDKENNTRCRYGRLLAYVQLPDDRFLNEVLLSEGFAYADTRFPHSRLEEYIQLEKTAREQKKGLWEKVTPDQMPKWRQK